MRLTLKFAHFNQRYVRLSQYKNSSERAFKSIEGQLDSLFVSQHAHESPQEALNRVLTTMGRK